MIHRTAWLAAAGLLLSACSAATTVGPITSSAPTLGATGNVAAPTTAGTVAEIAKIDMCAVVPLAEVQALSPFTTPLVTATPTSPIGGCEYRAAIDADDPVSVLLVLTTFPSASDARTALANQRQTTIDSDGGEAVSDVPGLGDAAYSYASDPATVHTVFGANSVDVSLHGEWPETPEASKIAAGVALTRLLLSRVP